MEQKSNGALIGSIIIIVLLIIGGVYLYQTSVKQKLDQKNTPATVQTQSTTDEFSTLENETNNIDLNNIDKNL
ncbi:MAG: hypothetical protein NTZ44_00930 [Candidatus Nomurabacteria bacterium]|nr:hypothetical protein [Candidatus Nomurabacteria bacterium]